MDRGRKRIENRKGMYFKVCSQYFYSKLNDTEKKVYEKVLSSLAAYKGRIILVGSYSGVDFQKVFSSLHDDIPEFFYVDFSAVSIVMAQYQTIITVKFLYSHKECERMKLRLADVVNSIKIETQHGDDKEKIIHDYLIQNVKYSSDLYGEEAHNVCGALLDHSAVCEGYARAFKLLCDEMDIPCIVISGMSDNPEGKNEKHAWNIVRKGKANFHIDVTWNSSLYEYLGVSLYYNVSDEFIQRDHRWDKRCFPSCFTRGEIEKEIVDVVSMRTFADAIEKMILSKRDIVIFRFNRKFDSSRDIITLINKVLSKKGTLETVSFSTTYLSKLDCAVICFEY